MSDKTDFKKDLNAYQAKLDRFRIVELPAMQYLMIDGHGDPNTSPAYAEAVRALYPVAYTLKFASKRDLGRDYVVMPLEGLWWAENMDSFTVSRDKSRWEWTLMIMTPDWIGQPMFEAAVEKARAAKDRPARLGDLRLEPLSEGRCVQTLHVGSFDDEADVLARMHQFIADNCLHLAGKHHEIYLSDPRKVAAEKLRTILRQPVRVAAEHG